METSLGSQHVLDIHVIADFAVGLYGLVYGFIGRLLDPCFMCASILRFRVSLHLPYYIYACKSDEIGN